MQALTDQISSSTTTTTTATYPSSSSSSSSSPFSSYPNNHYQPKQNYEKNNNHQDKLKYPRAQITLSARTSDELINAHLRCCPFPTALRLVYDAHRSSTQSLSSTTSNQFTTSTQFTPTSTPTSFSATTSSPHPQLTITTNAITSLLIHFDRHWRDYDSFDSPCLDADAYVYREETRARSGIETRARSSIETRASAYEGVSAREGRSLMTEAVMIAQVLATHLQDGHNGTVTIIKID